MQAIIYARTSKDDSDTPDGSKSIPEQVSECQALAKQLGYSVVATIKEPNRSGRTYPTGCPLASQDSAVSAYFHGKAYTRDGLAELLRLLPKAQIVIIRDNTRLARSLSDSFLLNWLHQQFTAAKVKIHSVRDGIQDGAHNLLLRTITSMSEDTGIQTRRANSMAKLQSNKDNGKLASGKVPYGYRNAGHQKVEIDAKAAHLVRRIYKMRLDGTTVTGIAKILNDENSGGKGFWSPDDVRTMLYKRPHYFGYVFNSRKQLIKSQVIPAILPYSIDIWKQMRSKYEQRAAAGKRERKANHPFSGLLFCGSCGTRLNVWSISTAWGSDSQRIEYHYYCPNHKYRAKTRTEGCKRSCIKEKSLFNFFGPWTAIVPLRFRATEDNSERVRELDAQRAKLIKAQDALFTRIADIERTTFVRQNKIIEVQMKAIDGELSKLNLKPSRKHFDSHDLENVYSEAIEFIKVFGDKIIIKLKAEDAQLEIPRFKYRSSTLLPFVTIHPSAFKDKRVLLSLACGGALPYGQTLYKSSWLELRVADKVSSL